MDHPLDENVLETEKYAFLLGCALRENNLEQFFSVYDAILPKHLTERQLDNIKDRARRISELPDAKFNVLVLSARDFSLAHCSPRMSSLEASSPSGPGTNNWNSGSEEEEDATDGKSGSYRNFTLNANRLTDDACERDSGLPSSGKGAGSCYNDMSDSEDRYFDYFPVNDSSKKHDSIKITHPVNPDFDEIHDVESDKSSIESPRSDASSTNEYNVTNPNDEFGTEMETFKDYSNPHKELYRHNEIPYMRFNNEDDDEFCVPTSYQQRRSVDDTVTFSSLNYSKTLEEAELGGTQRHRSFCGRGPPFGIKNQLENVSRSISGLLTPQDTLMSDDDAKKKNFKKKKGSKDDGDDRVNNTKASKSLSHDVNGNPIDITGYRQMRDLPSKSSEGSSRKPNYGLSHHELYLDTIPSQGQSAKEIYELGTADGKNKKPRKKIKEAVKLAEDIDNYVGDTASVDDLVKFIETGEKHLKRKVSQKTSPCDLAQKDKVAKKSKDKKVKIGQAEESSEGVFNSGEATSPIVSHFEAPLSPLPRELSPDTSQIEGEDMGNSGDKSAADTNVVDSEAPSEEKQSHPKAFESKVIDKDCESPEISSSKSPPLHKKDLEHKDKNKVKAKEKPLEGAQSETKKQKGKNGKDLQLKNNKKLENKNDIINNSKPVEKMKVENGPVAVAKGDSDLSITENYIFTDIDNLPPVEQEFTLVSKKKKRQGTKDFVPEIPRPKNGPKEYRIVPPPRSVTPPPPSSLLKKEQSRDLSPSSFPALGKKASAAKGRTTFREGRRNSFGDVPIDSLTELRSQDDSDIESVKSLPAAKGGSLSDVVSSRFPVSYAKMAAAPKPPNSPSSPKDDEYDDDDDEQFDDKPDNASSRKPTVWKGSPTERRHSIGSSPEDTKADNSPKFTQRSRQKSGSQECLLNIESVKSEVDVSVPDKVDKQSSDVSVVDVANVSSSGLSEQSMSEDPLSPGPQTPKVFMSSQPSESQPIPTITITDSNKVSNVLKTDSGSKPLNGPQRTHTEVSNSAAASRSQPAVSFNSSKDIRSKPVSVPRVPNNNSRKNNKSVIFLDKRFGDAPENLGITFGFDSNFEQDDIPLCESEPDKIVSDIPQELASRNELIHNQIEPQTISATPADISPAKPEPSATPLNEDGSVPPDNFPSSTKVSKTRVAGLNGVVLPKTQGYRNKPSSDALRTERVATSDPKGATASFPVSKDNNKTVLFFYGEGIVAKIGNSDVSIDSRDPEPPSSQRKGKLGFSANANHRGKFNVNEAVRYLKQEWDRVLDQKDKNPQAVQFYNGQ